uniref:Protein XRP2 n=1 Tax=Ciona savignyi TaxID=51511 RepID=H2YQW1_CIOSA
MGCFGSKEKEDPNKKTTEKAYSWDNRKNIDPKDFTIDGLNDGLVIRKPGSIDGQQFIIQNCSNSRIYLFDHIAAITVDDCSNCQIIIGPVKSSIFIRDCENCKFIVACQQFRTRDCSKLDVLLLCTTQPIIEASAKLKFGCYQFYYDGIEEQFEKSQLGLFCNNWSNIHDFTPVSDKANWSLIDEDCDVIEMFPGLQSKEDNQQEPELAELKISSKVEDSVVMLTHGSRKRKFSDTCFIVVFHCDTV